MNAKIKQVQEFYYLGSVATYDGNLDTEIEDIQDQQKIPSRDQAVNVEQYLQI